MLTELLRIVSRAAQPLAILWLIHLVAALVLIKKNRWREARFPLAVAAIIWLAACTPMAGLLLASLERPYAHPRWAELPICDAVVALGGTHRPSENDLLRLDLNPKADRIITAWGLMRQNKGRVLVLGGALSKTASGEQLDAKLIENWFANWEAIPAPVYDLGICGNTHDEAVALEAMAKKNGWKNFLLVTSASHMKRAEAVFKKRSLNVIPVACDFQVLGIPENSLRFRLFPKMEYLEQINMYLHEALGLLIYRWRGWI